MLDNESGFLFWYNLKDGNSVWMSEEDQEAYQAQTITAPTAETVSTTTNRTTKSLQSLNAKSIFQEEDSHDKMAAMRASEQKAKSILNESLGSQHDTQKHKLQERLRKKKLGAGPPS